MININEVKVGDCFSEQSYYRVKFITPDNIDFTHIGTGRDVVLSTGYVRDLLNTADQYQSEVKVGILDKVWTEKQINDEKKKDPNFNAQVGDLKQEGIKTIWSNVGGKVFTCCFEKKGKTLSKTAFDKLVKQQIDNAIEVIESAQISKRGVAKTAAQVIEEIIKNPITDYERGEDRILRGYKLQHESVDGFYQVVDLDITSGENKRLVNLNTLKWLVVGGVKYIVE